MIDLKDVGKDSVVAAAVAVDILLEKHLAGAEEIADRQRELLRKDTEAIVANVTAALDRQREGARQDLQTLLKGIRHEIIVLVCWIAGLVVLVKVVDVALAMYTGSRH